MPVPAPYAFQVKLTDRIVILTLGGRHLFRQGANPAGTMRPDAGACRVNLVGMEDAAKKNTERTMDADVTLGGRREMSMRDEKMETIVFRICVASAGWTVIESCCRKSLADFEARDDALEYAISLAQSQREAVVEVYGEGGLLEARSEYAFGGR